MTVRQYVKGITELHFQYNTDISRTRVKSRFCKPRLKPGYAYELHALICNKPEKMLSIIRQYYIFVHRFETVENFEFLFI
jgi:hypothetical protein